MSGIDLNLLVTLDALLEERHVSRAALRLNRSQPAVSHALSRLRGLLGDPLLVRRGAFLEPTARALDLAPKVRDVLGSVRTILHPGPFTPAQEQRPFRLGMSDYGAAILLPRLLPYLRQVAPGIDLIITQTSRDGMMAQIRDGELDLAFGVFPGLSPDLRRDLLFEESFVCIFDSATAPPESSPLSLEQYLSRPHLLVSLQGTGSEIDDALAACGHRRRVQTTLPHWAAAPRLIAGTDLILTVARRSVQKADIEPWGRIDPVPFTVPSFSFTQIWHPRKERDPAHQWLRETLLRLHSAPTE